MNRLDELKKSNVVFYGAGSMSHRVYNILSKYGIYPDAVVDSNPKNVGEYWNNNITISSYEDVRQRFDKYIILMTVAINHAVEIKKFLIEQDEKNPIYHMQCPFKVDDELLLCDDDIFELSEIFSDEISKCIFKDYINYKKTGDMLELLKYLDGDTFFDTHIIEKRKNHIFIDVGCYTGDTIAKFLMFCDNSYKQIVGMEADPGISKKANDFIKLGRIQRAEIINKGGWNEKRNMEFQTVKNNDDILFDSPNLFKSASDIIDARFKEVKDKDIYETVLIECDSLDNLFSQLHPTIIKINALAADLPILYGAIHILKNDRPYLIFDYGARPDYVKEMLEMLRDNCKDYKFYLRQKEIFGDYKTILYAVPEILEKD